jgi:hypothetical protein
MSDPQTIVIPPKAPDTPIKAETSPAPSRLDQIKSFLGDLARPLSIILPSFGATVATIVIAFRVKDFGEGAIFIGAVFSRAWPRSTGESPGKMPSKPSRRPASPSRKLTEADHDHLLPASRHRMRRGP